MRTKPAGSGCRGLPSVGSPSSPSSPSPLYFPCHPLPEKLKAAYKDAPRMAGEDELNIHRRHSQTQTDSLERGEEIESTCRFLEVWESTRSFGSEHSSGQWEEGNLTSPWTPCPNEVKINSLLRGSTTILISRAGNVPRARFVWHSSLTLPVGLASRRGPLPVIP